MESLSTDKAAQSPTCCHSCDQTLDIPWKCLACDILLCFRCGKKHILDDMRQDHRVINLKDSEQGPILRIKRCKCHPDYDIANFCMTCDQPICSRCLVQAHQGHSFQENEKAYKEKVEKLDEHHSKICSEYLMFVCSERNKLETIGELHRLNYEKEKQKIVEHDKNVKDKITAYTDKLLKDLDIQWENSQCEIQTLKSKMEKEIWEFEKKLKLIEEKQHSIDLEAVCDVTKQMDNFMQEVDISPQPLPKESKQYLQGVVNPENLERLLGSLQKTSLSKIIDFHWLKSYNTDLRMIGSIATNEDGTLWIRSFNELILRKIELDSNKQPKTLTEIKDFRVNNISTTISGDLLMIITGEPCIKRVTKSGEIINFYSFPKKRFSAVQLPLGLHCTKDGTVIVSTLEKGGEKYSVSTSSHRQLEIISQEGERLNLFELDPNGDRLLTWPCRISSNSLGDICVVDWTDSDNGRLVTLSSNGNPRWIYAGNPYDSQRLFNPYDVISTSDNGFIVSAKQNSIHILNQEGQIVKYQQTTDFGIEKPLSIGLDNEGNLLVGNFKGQLHVLKLVYC